MDTGSVFGGRMFSWLFGKSKDEDPNAQSEEDQIILGMYTAYEDIRFSRTDEVKALFKELDEYQRLNKLIEAAEELLAKIPVDKFSDIRSEVALVVASNYERRGLLHSKRHPAVATHPNNIQAIADFSRAIEMYRMADQELKQEIYEFRGYCYLDQHMPDKAIEDANLMIEKSECAKAYLLRGEAYSQLGNYDRAKSDITFAMELANRTQEKYEAFVLYSRVCRDIVTLHQLNLDKVVEQYEVGERNFRGVDLSWIDLSNINLAGTDLRDANLECSNLSDTILVGANLQGANLSNCTNNGAGVNAVSTDFEKANLESANLRGANLGRARFQTANLRNAHMPNIDLWDADFKDADLTGAFLTKAKLTDSQFVNCCLHQADLSKAILTVVDLSNSELTDANLSGANLQQARLVEANLEKANLSGAILFEATVTHARLCAANLSGANLAQADLSHSDLENANVANANLYHVNLTEANITNTNLVQAENLLDVQGISEAIRQQWWRKQ